MVNLFRQTSFWNRRGQGLGETVDCFDMALRLVIDQGYIRPGRREGTLEVSPILTIVGVACLRDVVTLATRVGIQSMFVRSMDDFAWSSSSSASHDKSAPFATENLLTVLNHCIKEVPVDAWPLEYLFSSIQSITMPEISLVPRALRTHVLASFCHILEILPRKLHLVDDEKPYIVVFAFGLHSLATAVLGNGSEELSQRVLDLAKTQAGIAARLNQTTHAKETETYRALIEFASMRCEWDLGPSDDYHERLLAFRASLPSHEGQEDVAKAEGLVKTLADNGLGAFSPSQEKEETLVRLGKLLEPHQGRGWADEALRTLALAAAALETLMCAGQHSNLRKDARVNWQQSLAERLELTLPGQLPLQQNSAQEMGDVFYKMTMVSLHALDYEHMGSATSQRDGAHDASERRLLETLYSERQWPELCHLHLDAAQALFQANEFRTGIGRLEELLQILHKAAAEPSLLSAATACYMRACFASLNNAYLIMSTPSRCERRGPLRPGVTPGDEDPDVCSAWWDRLHSLLGHDSSWTRQVFGEPHAHPLPLAIMTEMHRLHHRGENEQVLYQLAALERVSKSTLFLENPSPYPLPAIRDLFELVAHQQHAINDILDWAARDPAVAEAKLEALEGCMPSFCKLIDQTTIQSLRLVIERHWLSCLRLGKYKCETPTQMRALYRKFRHLLDNGRLQYSSKASLSRVACSFLTNLALRAAKNQMWGEGLRWINELFATVDLPSMRLDGEMRARLESTRRVLRDCHLSELMDTAEASLDFEQCVALAERAEGFRSDDSVNVNIHATSLTSWTGGVRVMAFLKQAYLMRCLPCARWVRQGDVEGLYSSRGRAGRIFRRVVALLLSRNWASYRSAGLARWKLYGHGMTRGRHGAGFKSFPRRQLRWRTPKMLGDTCRHYGRYGFAAPFGCRHRCEGGYCFYDRE